MRKKIVIALGGNALGNSPSEQLELVKVTAKNIVDLVEAGKFDEIKALTAEAVELVKEIRG